MALINYLIKKGLVTSEQVEEALYRQQRRGGLLEDQLYLLGVLDESSLLQAIRECHGWKTVTLREREFPGELMELIPFPLAWRFRVLPFARDIGSATVCVACRNPEDATVHRELREIMNGGRLELFAAVGALLDSLILENYRGQQNALSSHALGLDEPNSPSDKAAPGRVDRDPTAIVISPDPGKDQHIGRALAGEGFEVTLADSPGEVIDDIADMQPELVLIREADYGLQYDHLRRTLQLAAGTTVRSYSSAADFFLPDANADSSASLLVANLRLATTILAKKLDCSQEPGTQMGPLVDALCRKFHLSPHDRLVTISTAYLLGISSLCIKDNHPDKREVALFKLLALAEDAVVFPPSVLKAIRRMYTDLTTLPAREVLTTDVRIGNILTIVDFYIRHYPVEDRLPAHRYRAIEEHLRSLTESLFLPEAVERFLELLRDEFVVPDRSGTSYSALVLNEAGFDQKKLTECLESCGFECVLSDSADVLGEQYQRIAPEALIIAARGNTGEITHLLEKIAAEGIVYSSRPSIVLYDAENHQDMHALLRLGLYDVVGYSESLDILRLLLQRMSAEKESESRQRLRVLQEMGTHGSLAHMNVIDLLQAMGPGNKTLRISVSAHSNHLTMYLHNGQLINAECEDREGADAVYEALNWGRGIWSVDHIDPSDLPEPNVHRSIDSILIEGCHILDELKHARPIS